MNAPIYIIIWGGGVSGRGAPRFCVKLDFIGIKYILIPVFIAFRYNLLEYAH